MISRPILLFVVTMVVVFFAVAATVGHGRGQPALMLANVYQDHIDPTDYWVSEKLDGVRAYWDGRHLISRQGHVIATPPGFTDGFPDIPMDGELWQGRGTFSRLMGALQRARPEPDQWRHIYYMVFDLPAADGSFEQRLRTMRALLDGRDAPHLRRVPQRRVANRQQLMDYLDQVVEIGGEGLMLHRGSAPYRGHRSDDLLKLKPYQDEDGRVVAHLPGQGRLEGRMGALLVETPSGRHFRLGTGFSDAQRADPPPIGSIVTYQFHGHTKNGLPRFASYLRTRSQGPGYIR
ncbi:DNA ligase [Alloalcanivorax gelatiniphagus]|uniref:DNA ligase n=1 Tax=Alloalcanivorax gelatiniphagus TaxID=1194167 RepID=A0ABY2XNL9_9GAMM|nr:DNA ligase [Alloalcanivorax gelatiniphagus]TMW13073.1 DNA ligase [Alloalcanivorax gelatiniphagus]|tara:strand:+ start:1761 stop:2633 length:873 start_codon:yes stop_codon:yes gene_type:complete